MTDAGTLCTAGHVDHGKSTLVRALTGMEPDRLAEERRRGLTIDLGFAWAELTAAGRKTRMVSFVDLPGHERFVGTMLAGAGAIDVALFIVAADEGWMPQSAEHLAILDLLGVIHGVVALTKADSVDPDTLALGQELVREELEASGLAAAPIVGVSAKTGEGLPELIDALLGVLDEAPESADLGRPRLWVDRAFSVRGAGTVVTGTLGGGSLRIGDELGVLPGRHRGRVRGLQSLNRPVDVAQPGTRVAVNLSGVDRDQVGRGDVLGLPDQWRSVWTFDAQLRALPGLVLGRRGAWHVHAGSAERLAALAPVLGRPVTGEGQVTVTVDRPLALVAGDRVVLREAGRRATAGGGVVLDVDPPARPRGALARRARAAALDARAKALAAGDRAALLDLHVRERDAAGLPATASAVGLTPVDAARAARTSRMLTLGPWLVSPRAAGRWSDAVRTALADHHAAHPLDRVAPRDVAVRAARGGRCPGDLAVPFVDALVKLGRVVADGPGVRHPEHQVRLDPQSTTARRRLLAELDSKPFSPPGLAEAAHAAGASPALVGELEAAGDLVRLGPDLAVLPATLDLALRLLRTASEAEGALTASRAKEVLGTSRKYALPLLEELDRRGHTRRDGDLRAVLGPPSD